MKKLQDKHVLKNENIELENIKNEVQCIKSYFGGNTGCPRDVLFVKSSGLNRTFFFSWIGLKPFKTTCKHRKKYVSCLLHFHWKSLWTATLQGRCRFLQPTSAFTSSLLKNYEKKKDLSHPQHACTSEGKTHECYFMYGSHNITQMCLVATFLEKTKKSGCCVYHFNMTKSLAHCIWDVRLLRMLKRLAAHVSICPGFYSIVYAKLEIFWIALQHKGSFLFISLLSSSQTSFSSRV